MYVPGVHGMQSVSASFPFALETFPREQSLQRSELLTPEAEEYLPRLQFSHAVVSKDCEDDVPCLPASHAMQLVWLEPLL